MIKGSFIKAGIIVPEAGDDDYSEERTSSNKKDAVDPGMKIDPAILSLFKSDTVDEDFDGFDDLDIWLMFLIFARIFIFLYLTFLFVHFDDN